MAIGLAAALVVAACSGIGDTADPATTTTATPAGSGDATTSTVPLAEGTLGEVELATQEIAELDAPIAMAARPSSADLYIAEKRGTVRLVKVTTSQGSTTPRYQLQNTPVLDLSDEVIDQGEQGLLGLTFSSDGRDLYVDFTAQPDGRTVVLEYALGDRTTVDLDSRRGLLEVEQPAANHNGGNLVLGPDGYLYVGLGDGGGAGDPDGNGQDTDALLGKILRIDPQGGTEDDPYAIPAGNPFVGGEDGAPEVWLYGVRNPWRFSFDTLTGDLWIGDVGQGEWEEIDRLPSTGGFDAGRGANLGWDRMEGSHEFEGDNPAGAVLPIHEYSHDDGCSITGGFVYRGSDIPELAGAYLYADFCTADVRAIQVDGDTVIDERSWDLSADQVQSFGQDDDGELFVLLASGPVLKLVPPEESDEN
ncbi:MAG: PQQ-dependent sugar dehydrogenase [Acidimicrobiales bacterium]